VVQAGGFCCLQSRPFVREPVAVREGRDWFSCSRLVQVVEGKSKECDAKRDEENIGAVMEKAWENYTVDGA
jgi:hypothetical protein